MSRVLVVYFSKDGHTRQMAQYIAEGLRFEAVDAEIKDVSEINAADDLVGYDGYIFGSPTYHRDMSGPIKRLLDKAADAGLAGKLAGAFGSYTHSGDAPGLIFDTMEYAFKMDPFQLRSFNLLEDKVATQDGMRSCHDYGRTFGETLAKA